MPELRWDEVREYFDPGLTGALPDLFVPGASTEDWQAVLDLVTASGWQWQYEESRTARPLPVAAEVLARSAGAEQASLKVWPAPGVLVIFWFMTETQIDFDVDLRELQGQQGADTLSGLLRAIGIKLGKPVLMIPEGGSLERPVLGFDPALNKVTLLATQHPTEAPAGRSRRAITAVRRLTLSEPVGQDSRARSA